MQATASKTKVKSQPTREEIMEAIGLTHEGLMKQRVQKTLDRCADSLPEGYIPQSTAFRRHGRGLSREVFNLVLSFLDVKFVCYWHVNADGRRVPARAWYEREVPAAITAFLDNAVQITSCTCISPLLGDKRFFYSKDR